MIADHCVGHLSFLAQWYGLICRGGVLPMLSFFGVVGSS